MVHFKRPFQDWKLEGVTHFLDLIYSMRVQEGENTLLWREDRKGNFSVKSHYNSLCVRLKQYSQPKKFGGLELL